MSFWCQPFPYLLTIYFNKENNKRLKRKRLKSVANLFNPTNSQLKTIKSIGSMRPLSCFPPAAVKYSPCIDLAIKNSPRPAPAVLQPSPGDLYYPPLTPSMNNYPWVEQSIAKTGNHDHGYLALWWGDLNVYVYVHYKENIKILSSFRFTCTIIMLKICRHRQTGKHKMCLQ